MAERIPEDVGLGSHDGGIQPKQVTLYTHADAAATIQHYDVWRRALLISDCFHPLSSTSDSWTIMSRYHTAGRNLCGATPPGGETTGVANAYVYCWASDASNFSFGIYKASTTSWVSTAVSASHTSKLWRAVNIDFMSVDGSDLEIQLGLRRDSGAGTIYVGGIGIWSETYRP